ncbi:hypothetical protein LJC02_00800 [Breznakia sp. OttesenSCG-928-G09]|nr:hypothetical protein [Breznakia sp. OttesenSCG-928-G09]
MKYKISYEGLGGVIDFSKAPFIYADHNLFDYEFSYDSTNMPSQNKTILNQIYSLGKVKTISLQVIGTKKAEILNDLETKLNYDIEAKQPGKLYVNDEYINCYLVASSKKEWNQYEAMEYITLSLFCESPKWITEKTYDFSIYEKNSIDGGFHFPLSFPVSFKYSWKNMDILNNHYAPVKCKLYFYGPIKDPKVRIGENLYAMNGELLDSERYIIDQNDKTIVKITAAGETVNCFDERDKSSSIFLPIQIGENRVDYDGTFSFSICLYTERNEPRWI